MYGAELPYHLVFLSACETATGEGRRGEGCVGLARGFFYAGVQSMITTLWTISDRAAVDIVDVFYANIAAGRKKDRALREAQLEYLETQRIRKDKLHAHPYYWAAFIPIGNLDGMQPVPEAHHNMVYIIMGMLLMVALYLVFQKNSILIKHGF